MKRPVKFLALAVYTLFWVGLCYALLIGFRARKLFDHVKTGTIMSSGIFRADETLGFAAYPGATGTLFFTALPNVPIRFDENGFRVPMDYDSGAKKPGGTLLTLGCSFTDGFACPAEQTYPYLLGDRLNARTLNAGFGAYGLSQMLIQAHEFIPKFKPDYTIIQYSPWLITRALNEYAPNDIGKRPQPFFWRDDEGQVRIHGPAFQTTAFRYPVADYRDASGGGGGFASFLFRIGFPFFINNDIHIIGLHLRQTLGLLPRPNRDRLDILRYAYGHMRDLCRENGSQMVICSLAHPWDIPRPNEVAALQSMQDVIFVDGWAALTNMLSDDDPETYQRAYAHYGGNPPVLVDGHPNPAAHALIAEAIAQRISSPR